MDNGFKVTATLSNNNIEPVNITEQIIENLVHSFYEKVREDDVLGPIFHNAIKDDWDRHLKRMCDFWSSIALSTKRYHGQPMLQHLNISPKLEEKHFQHWLFLFEENARNVCDAEVAVFFIERARKIAQSLMLGISFHHKELKL